MGVEPAGPTIKSISPNPVNTGLYTVTLTGSGFTPSSVIAVGGIHGTPVYVNSTTLKYTGNASAAGTVPFQIANPGTLWGPALSVPFKDVKPPQQTISPTTASVNLKATLQFVAPNATSWTATAGTITSSGLYIAPATMSASASVTVTASGPGGIASAIVTVVNPNPQTISPTIASVKLGAMQQFASPGATTWTTSAETVSAIGLYTAPAGLTASGTATVTGSEWIRFGCFDSGSPDAGHHCRRQRQSAARYFHHDHHRQRIYQLVYRESEWITVGDDLLQWSAHRDGLLRSEWRGEHNGDK